MRPISAELQCNDRLPTGPLLSRAGSDSGAHSLAELLCREQGHFTLMVNDNPAPSQP